MPDWFDRVKIVLAVMWLVAVGAWYILHNKAQADEYLVLSGKSWHQIEGDWNEENWGIGYESNAYFRDHKTSLSAGGYVDSNSNNAYYVGAGYEYRLGDSDWFVGGTAQFTYREDLYGGWPGPMAFLSASYDGPVGINIVWVPTIVVGVQFKVEL